MANGDVGRGEVCLFVVEIGVWLGESGKNRVGGEMRDPSRNGRTGLRKATLGRNALVAR